MVPSAPQRKAPFSCLQFPAQQHLFVPEPALEHDVAPAAAAMEVFNNPGGSPMAGSDLPAVLMDNGFLPGINGLAVLCNSHGSSMM